MKWSLPENIATYGGKIDAIFWVITVVTGIAFVLVEVGIIWFAVKYRRREGRRAYYTHGNKALEVLWTSVPALALVALGIYSADVWAQIKGRDSAPAGSLMLGVRAKQFEWNVTYPGADGTLGTSDDFVVRNQLHFPVNRPILIQLESEDVLHSFFIPQLRVKQDAVPGMTIPVWFEATKTGGYQIGCAELCGLGHYRMRARVTIHEPDEYERWHAEQVASR
ncbi:MAG: cytochrome c oxidase subunit II [Gemmatimonadetes bacterium]|nr:cytochrome c oxidase subunit II [Gemmatimonadota bacterium]MCZ6824618.1 cytochrome c oxidase subunit II [Gemmatimonadota bacterium]